MQFRTNEDVRLTRSELSERFQGLVARADANHDGILTQEELRQIAAAAAGASRNLGPDHDGLRPEAEKWSRP